MEKKESRAKEGIWGPRGWPHQVQERLRKRGQKSLRLLGHHTWMPNTWETVGDAAQQGMQRLLT